MGAWWLQAVILSPRDHSGDFTKHPKIDFHSLFSPINFNSTALFKNAFLGLDLARRLFGGDFEQLSPLVPFFSSGLADVALRLGPDRNISGEKQLYKDSIGPCTLANHDKKAQTNKQQSQDDPQIPQPDLRFVTETSKQQQRGKAQTTTPTKRFASGHSDICHRVSYKNMQKLIVHCDNS